MIYNTESRKKILDFLRENKERSFSAEEIFSKLSRSGAGKSTVFRQLAKLLEGSEIKRITSTNSRAVRYQYLDREHCGGHLHLKCSSCGMLIHLDDGLSNLFDERIKNAKSFSIDMTALIPGICASCMLKEGAV